MAASQTKKECCVCGDDVFDYEDHIKRVHEIKTPKCPVKFPPNHKQSKEGWPTLRKDQSEYSARKVSMGEMERKSRGEKAIEVRVMLAYSQLVEAIGKVYRQLENDAIRIFIEGEPNDQDKIDGPRNDIKNLVKLSLDPAREEIESRVAHEIFSACDELKTDFRLL